MDDVEIESVGSSMSSAFDELEPFALEGTRSSFFAPTEASTTEDTFLSSLLQEREKKRKMSLRNVARSIMAMSQRSFRKGSRAAADEPPSADRPVTEGPPKLTSTRKMSEVSFVALDATNRSGSGDPDHSGTGMLRSEVEAWIAAPAGENIARVKAIKSILSGGDDELCNAFLGPELSDDEQGATGLASLMLSKAHEFRAQPNSDTKLSQAFDILMAAAVGSSTAPSPMPEPITSAVDLCIRTWRSPLSSLFALRFIIALSPAHALPHCKTVLMECEGHSFRITEAALVCVAEESLEGTLPDPSSWVPPVLSVLRLLTATKLSGEMLTLALDVLSFTLTCGGSAIFIEYEGHEVFAKLLRVATRDELSNEVVRRIVKLLHPNTLDVAFHHEDGDEPASDPLSSAGAELSHFGFPMSPRAAATDSEGSRSPHSIDENNLLTLVPSPSHAGSRAQRTNTLSNEVLQVLIQSLTLIVSKFITKDEDFVVLEECSVTACGYLLVNSEVFVKERVLTSLCHAFIAARGMWQREAAVAALLMTIQTFMAERNRSPRSGLADPLAASVLGDAKTVKQMTITTSTVTYYRCIMDDPPVLWTCCVALRCYARRHPTSCPPLAAVLKAMYILAHAEPARSHLLGAKLRGGKAPQLLIPALMHILRDTKAAPLHRYAYSIIHRLCKGPHRFACSVLLGWVCGGGDRDSDADATTATSGAGEGTDETSEHFIEMLGNRIVVERVDLVHSMMTLGAELARYCTLPGIAADEAMLQHFFAAILTAFQSYSHEPFVVTLTCMTLGHLSRYGAAAQGDTTAAPCGMVCFAVESGALDVALQLLKDHPGQSDPVGYLLAALSLHPTAAAAITDEDALSAIEATSRPGPRNADSPTLGGKGAASGKALELVTRDDRGFCRQQLARINGMAQHQADMMLRSPGIAHLSPTFSGTFMMPSTLPVPQGASQRGRRPSSVAGTSSFEVSGAMSAEVAQMLEHQRMQLLNDFNELYRELIDSERELRAGVVKQHEERVRNAVAGARRRSEELRAQRAAVERNEVEARCMIERFCEEEFLSIVSYSQRSLQKKVTVLHKQMTRMGSAMLRAPRTPHEPGMDEYTFGSRRVSLADNVAVASADTDSNPCSESPPPPGHVVVFSPEAEEEMGGGEEGEVVGPPDQGRHSIASQQSHRHSRRQSHFSRDGASPILLRRSRGDNAPAAAEQTALAAVIEAVSTLQRTVADMHRDHTSHMQHLVELTRSAMTPTPPPPTAPPASAAHQWRSVAAPSWEPPLRPTSAQLFRDHSPAPVDDPQFIAAVAHQARILTRRPWSASTARQRNHPAPEPPTASPRSLAPRAPLVSNAKVSELAACLRAERATITSLDLSRHYLGDSGLLELLPAISALECLRFVSLRQNGLTAAVVPMLLECLPPHALESLDLSMNKNITPRAGRAVVAFVRSAQRLTTVTLNGTQLFASTRAIIAQVLAERQLSLACHEEDGAAAVVGGAAATA